MSHIFSTEPPKKELELLDHIRSKADTLKGQPDKILDEIDGYGRFMTIGRDKGKVIIEQMDKIKPKTMIELGCYVGYSAILFGSHLPQGSKYFSFEINPRFAEIAREIIDLAGLSDIVTVIVGPAAETLPEFAKEHDFVDLAFIDHSKAFYVPDFRVLETLKLIRKGSVIAADNIFVPGAPEYKKYVNLTQAERKEYNETTENESGKQFVGIWQNKYKSETVCVHNDAVEITEIVE